MILVNNIECDHLRSINNNSSMPENRNLFCGEARDNSTELCGGQAHFADLVLRFVL